MPSCRLSLKNWNPEISKSFPRTLGMGAWHSSKRMAPFAFVVADYRFIPGTRIKDCMQLMTAIHLISPFQQMAIMFASQKEARERPQALQGLPILRKPFRIEQLLRLLRQPVLPLSVEWLPSQ